MTGLNKKYFLIFSVLFLLLAVILILHQIHSSNELSSVKKLFNLKEYTLKNGLRIYIKEDHRAPAAVACMIYKVGQNQGPKGAELTPLILEHLMFHIRKNSLMRKWVDFVYKNGVSNWAFTSSNYTYYQNLTNIDALPMILKWEADRMQYMQFSEEDFQLERKVVAREIGLSNNDSVKGSLKDVVSFYRNWYIPNNAFILIVGDVHSEEIYSHIRKIFESIKKSSPIISSSERKNTQISRLPSLNLDDLLAHLPISKSSSYWKDVATLTLIANTEWDNFWPFDTEMNFNEIPLLTKNQFIESKKQFLNFLEFKNDSLTDEAQFYAEILANNITLKDINQFFYLIMNASVKDNFQLQEKYHQNVNAIKKSISNIKKDSNKK